MFTVGWARWAPFGTSHRVAVVAVRDVLHAATLFACTVPPPWTRCFVGRPVIAPLRLHRTAVPLLRAIPRHRRLLPAPLLRVLFSPVRSRGTASCLHRCSVFSCHLCDPAAPPLACTAAPCSLVTCAIPRHRLLPAPLLRVLFSPVRSRGTPASCLHRCSVFSSHLCVVVAWRAVCDRNCCFLQHKLPSRLVVLVTALGNMVVGPEKFEDKVR